MTGARRDGFSTRAKRDNLIRVSVGWEDLEDLPADFELGLAGTGLT